LEYIARTTATTLERLERRFETIARRFDGLTSEHRADFRLLQGIMLGGFTAMIGGFTAMFGVMAHGFHWL
jgi:hypothetical protein